MARKFWFGKRKVNDSSDRRVEVESDKGSAGVAVIMADSVFPTGFSEHQEDSPVEASDPVPEHVDKDVEAAKNKIVSENKTSVKSLQADQDDGIIIASKESPVKLFGNKESVKFATRSIPGVVDGGSSDGRPVLTPVRQSATTAPVKLKSVVKTISATDQRGTKKPTTSALKVVNKEVVPTKDDLPKFGLHAHKAGGINDIAEGDPSKDNIQPQKDQRALYYQLMNGLYDAILVLDDHGHVVDCNDRVLKVLGFSREDAWDLPIEDVIKGMTSQMFAHLKRNLAESHHVLITARCYRNNGDSFKGEIGVSTLSLTRDNNVVFAIRNVDQRKSTMAELRKSSAAFDIALVPAFACNLEGFFTAVNKCLLKTFGIPDEKEAKKARFIDILPDASRVFAKSVNGETVHEKIMVTTAEGEHVKVEIALTPIKNGSEITGVAGSILLL